MPFLNREGEQILMTRIKRFDDYFVSEQYFDQIL